MSGMSSMLYIVLYREAPFHHEPNEKGRTAARDATIPKSRSPFSFSSLHAESSSTWVDAQYAAHFAHAVDPSVLDVRAEVRIHPYRGLMGGKRPLAMPRSTDRLTLPAGACRFDGGESTARPRQG